MDDATNPDQAILDAWERREEAYRVYGAMGDHEVGRSQMSPAEKRLWEIIDGGDEFIRSAVASTPRGVSIQLWVALYHSVTGRDDDAAISHGDLEQLTELEDRLDFNARMILAALRSLRAIEAVD